MPTQVNSPTAGGVESSAPVSRSFRGHPSSLYQVRQFIRGQAALAEIPAGITDDILLAVSEAAVNAVLHTASALFRVAWRRVGDCIDLEVEDEGIFNRRIPMPEVDDTGGGRGILIMTAVMDEVGIREGTPRRPGTVVRLHKCAAEHADS